MTLDELYKSFLLKLEGIENASVDLRVIIKKVLNINETEFLINKHKKITEKQINEIQTMVQKRISGIPVQYIIGEWDFYGSTFKVNKNVLIPRPETELLCELVIEHLKDKKHAVVADLCAGSGCIGITIKKFLENTKVYMVEKSPAAAMVCKYNIKSIVGCNNIFVVNGDIFYPESLGDLPKFDLIVSNPPYIKSADIPGLQSEVLFEPEMALDGGEDGFDFYRVLCEKWTDYLTENGIIALECGEEQADEIKNMLEKKNLNVCFVKDYNNIDRFVIGKKVL